MKCLRDEDENLQGPCSAGSCQWPECKGDAQRRRERAEMVNAHEQRRIMTVWHQQAVALGFDGVPDLIASVMESRTANTRQ